ncbi:UDP-N-acetylglucosamine--N-acetylmuramyl-(pentapeptide) pyrophosphoryl-undecaprenol N-acetylglucosamine transferase [Methanococcoides burtonii]|uniref:Glycosyltransferase-domain protein n=1 Tax=Methanococcoides burtonii (strain DSM 6242 / NBRC 107633 / OCM 468 / ACE-M) TaxID=259564 RepID=Q12TG8_METBU|nr:glycosyltransferase family protein [Methanococcoides burtonii]ABE53258.1 glycosyltransferase-domain protein [Methanococcoides burtonii DSM 6242]
MKIMIFVCGEGLGHTSRCISLAQQMKTAGHEVLMGAYGYSKDLIKKKGLKTAEIIPEIQLVGDSGSLDLKSSVIATIKSGQFMGIGKIHRTLKEFKPDLVISDSYYTGIFFAWLRKKPVYLMVNQSNMEEFFMGKGILMGCLGNVTKRFYTRVFRKVDGIIIPDFPMPNTICKYNLDFEERVLNSVFYSGPLVGKKYKEVREAELTRPHVLSTIGGFGYREPLFHKVIETARLDRNINYTLLSGPSIKPDKYTDLPENVTIMEFIDEQFPYLKASDIVIAPGGHSMMMEALSFGVPILSFPDMGHIEQENNATSLEEEGCGKRLEYSISPEKLLEHIHQLIEDDAYKDKTQYLRSLSHALNGPETITEMLGSKHMNQNSQKNI